MKAFIGRLAHTVKMNNKPVGEGYKMQAVADCGYVWHFMQHSYIKGMLEAEFKIAFVS